MFSLHSLGDTYQESYQEPYQSYEVIRYDKEYGPWPSSRSDCMRYHAQSDDGAYWHPAGNGNNRSSWSVENRSQCTIWVRRSFNYYTSPCDFRSVCYDRYCPKGWGIGVMDGAASRADEYAAVSQGYVRTYISKPVYGYVTRYRTQYRTAYYAYISARVAKA